MQTSAVYMFSGILLLSAVACSSDPKADQETWYEQSRRHSQMRQDYVDTYMDQGLSELEAKQSWELQEMIRKTEVPRHAVIVDAEELMDMVPAE